MKDKIILSLLTALLVAFVYYYAPWRNNATSNIESSRTANRGRVGPDRAPTVSGEKGGSSGDESPQVTPSQSSQPTPKPKRTFAEVASEMMDTQVMQDAVFRGERFGFEKRYKDTFKGLGLTEAQVANVLDLLAVGSMKNAKISAAIASSDGQDDTVKAMEIAASQEKEDLDQMLVEAVENPQTASAIQEAVAKEQDRSVVAKLIASSSKTSAPVSPELADSLVTQTYQIRQNFQFTEDFSDATKSNIFHLRDQQLVNNYILEVTDLQNRQAAAIRPLLSAEQLEQFQRAQADELARVKRSIDRSKLAVRK